MFSLRGTSASVTDLARSLGDVSALWLDARNPLRAETVQALQVSTGLTLRQIEMALTNCFEELTTSQIMKVVDFGAWHQSRSHSVFHILPANAFTAWVHGAVITLALGHQCYLKPSMREPVFARAWKKSLNEINPDISSRVEMRSWDEKTSKDIDAVVAYGSDETLQEIRKRLPSNVRFAGYGHKLSLGIIFKEVWRNSSEDIVQLVRRDAEPFELQGCLSPQILFVESPGRLLEQELKAFMVAVPKIRSFSHWPAVRSELEKSK